MKIAVFRYRGVTKPVEFKNQVGASALCACLTGTKLNHADAYNTKLDYALMVTTEKACEWLIENGKSTKWKKIISIPAAGLYEINRPDFFTKIKLANFDAFLVPPDGRWDVYQIFNKPLIPYTYPGDMSPVVSPKKNRVVVYIKNLRDKNTNFLSSLAVFSKLPRKVTGVVTTNPAIPYSDDVIELRKIVAMLGLGKRLEVIDPQPRSEYLKEISNCKVIIDMDNRGVWGRNVQDALTIKAYCVGTHSVFQQRYFSKLITNDIGEAACMAKSALSMPTPTFNLKVFTPEYAINDLKNKLRKT